MQTTGNLGLKKPDGTDIVDIGDLNGNMDILDTAVKNVQDHAADAVKHITATERTAWNAKASTATATISTAGLMAASDKYKLDGVASGANNYSHPNHTGDVTSTGDGLTAIAPGVIVNADINAAAAIDASKIGTGVVSNAEFGYLDGVTSGIQGQLNARPLLTTTPQQTTGDITFYVRTDGNDNNTGLANTSGGAFKTIGKAIWALPQIINHQVIINVAAGTYPEKVNVAGFSGSNNLTIQGASAATTTHMVNGFDVFYNSINVRIIGFTGTRTDAAPFNAVATQEVFFYRCLVTANSASYAFNADEGAMMYLGQCIISNRGVAVYAQVEAKIFTSDLSGSANTVGYRAYFGGKITVTGTLVSSTYGYESQHGGQVLTSAGVISPWGDNTHSSRPITWSTMSVSAYALTANTWNFIKYGGVSTNNSNGYNGTAGIFTSPQDGWYKVRASAMLLNVPVNQQVQIRILLNGSIGYVVDLVYATTLAHQIVNGETLLYLQPGQTVQVQIYVDSAVWISTGSDTTRLEIIRVA
ncbi:C1q-like domain-containing protein [Paenibacillus sp. HW567]|uniref:C1q-like domain-containing protein n=1 Tax=Paenibacillus sp. HW567 TaxID=1034769 RepID=UPI00036F38FA|nr:pectinesterase family protein [Paenibacillus sp. HW567]